MITEEKFMKRFLTLLFTGLMVFCLAACGGGNNELKESDLKFIFGDSIFDNKENASFQFTNNSNYKIFRLELMMRLKEDAVVPDNLKKIYDEITEAGIDVFIRVYFNQYWDSHLEYPDDEMWAKKIIQPVKPGETSGKTMIHRNNIQYVPDSSELDNFEFEKLTVRYYIDDGAYEKTLIYNYQTKKHTYGDPKLVGVKRPIDRELEVEETSSSEYSSQSGFFDGVSNAIEDSKDEAQGDIDKFNNILDGNSSTISKAKLEQFIKGYEKAEFARYNSPASENGLGDSRICFYCTLDKIEFFEANETTSILGYVTDEGGNEWLIQLHFVPASSKNAFDSYVGKELILRGVYIGFSLVKEMPVAVLEEMIVVDTGKSVAGMQKLLDE